MTPQEEKIHNAIYENSFVFFRDFIDKLTGQDNGAVDHISKELVILTVSSLQISMELAVKARVIQRTGLRNILDSAAHAKTDDELYALFAKNKLKTLSFEKIKQFAKAHGVLDFIADEDFDTVAEFQNYRNGIVHLSFNFHEGDYFDLKYDIVFFVTNILVHVLSGGDDRPNEFLRNELGEHHFHRLTNYIPFVVAMENLARTLSRKTYFCIICNKKSYAKDAEYCYVCGFDGELGGEFIDCISCREEKAVIFDHLNISLNDNIANGQCLNCQFNTLVYKCPSCGIAYDVNLPQSKACDNDRGCQQN